MALFTKVTRSSRYELAMGSDKMHTTVRLVEDSKKEHHWAVLDCLLGKAWIELEYPPVGDTQGSEEGLMPSSLFEVDLETGDKVEIHPHPSPYLVNAFLPTDEYLYLAVLTDSKGDAKLVNDDSPERQKLVRYHRSTGESSVIWSSGSTWEQIRDVQVVNNAWALLRIGFSPSLGVIVERYDLLEITTGNRKTIYVDDEEWVDANLLLTETATGPVIIRDRHISPSDKEFANGLPDLIDVIRPSW